MRLNLFTYGLACGVLVMLAGGCAGRFAGEWVEVSCLLPANEMRPVSPGQRMALEFTNHWIVRAGTYSDLAGAVDADSIQSAQYNLFKDGEVIEFGSKLARLENGQLITFVQGQPERRFVKVRGKSVFPPIVVGPELTQKTNSPSPDQAVFAANWDSK
jgi:hypothetical protein